MHRTQSAKNPLLGHKSRLVPLVRVLIWILVWKAPRPDRARTVSWAASLLLPSHPKSSVHQQQCRRQNRRDSNVRKITASGIRKQLISDGRHENEGAAQRGMP